MATFDSDFTSGEEMARRLKRRMEEKLKVAEAAAAQAETDKRFSRRLRDQARRETEVESKAPRGSTSEADEAATQRRLARQNQMGKAAQDELRTRSRISGELRAQEQSTRRLLNAYKSGPLPATRAATLAEQQLLLSGGAGGRQPPREPPRFFAQPPPPEEPPRRRPALPPGSRQLQIAQYSEPHPERAGQVIAERELRVANETTAARLRATEATTRGIGATDRLGASIGREASIQASANREFQRFGALSSEWIGAAGRGATTMQELGRQTTATIGKFGGWLAAGSLIFTALDGMRQIGKGAIDSLSGVNQLQRVLNTPVDADALQKAFRDQSSFFNLPIEQVSDATYEMGKVFKTQEEALEGAKAVLYAVKVGELDTATASRYLIAAINGFGIPANKMQLAFDEINQAQNEFGVSISDGLAGVAKAAGAWDAASRKGGPMERYHNLLAFIATAQKVTGQTGNVVGTAVQRVPGQLAQSNNQAILKRFGINPKDDIQKIFEQAFELSKEGKISGRERLELASAIFGKQYGPRIGAPTFAKPEKYEQVAKKTLPEFATGSGERELNTQLDSAEERIKRIGTELGNIGSGLAEAHFFDFLGLGLNTLNFMLRDVNQLLELFNKLPEPMKQFVVYAGQARLILGALRKFNIGDNFAEGTLGRNIFSGPNRTARLYDEQLVGIQKQLREELGGVNLRTVKSARQVETAREKSVAAASVRDEAAKTGIVKGVKTEAYLAAESNALAAEAAYQRSLGRYADLSNERLAILQELKSKEETAAALQAQMTNANARQLASKEQEVIQGSFNKGAQTTDDYARQLGYRFEQGPNGPILTAIPEAEQQAAQKAARAAAATGAETSRIQSIRTKLTGGFSKARLAFSSTEQALLTAKSGISKLGTSLRSLFSTAGGLTGVGTLALLAIPLAEPLIKKIAENVAGGQHDIDVSEHLFDPDNSRQLRKLQGYYKDLSDKELEALPRGGVVDGAPSWYDVQRALDDRRLKRAYRLRAQRFNPDHFLEGRLPDELAGRLQDFAGLDPNSPGYDKARRKLENEIRTGDKAANPGKAKQVTKHFEEVVAKNINKQGKFFTFLGEFDKLSDKLLEQYQKNLTQIVAGGPAYASQKDVRALVRTTEIRGLRNLSSGKSSLEAKGVQALSELTQSLAAYGQEEFKLAQTLARTDKQRSAAYRPYLKSLRFGLDQVRKTKGTATSQIRNELQRIEGQQKHLESEGANQDPEGNFFNRVLDVAKSAKANKRYDALQKKAKELRAKGKQISRALTQQEKQLRALIREQEDARTEEHIGVLNEIGQLASARIGGEHPVAQARTTLRYAEQALAYARGHDASQKVIRGALQAVYEARETLQQSIKSEAEELASAREALAVSRANGDPIKEAQAELAKALSDLDNARKPAERLQAEAELLDAEHKLEEARAEIALSKLGLESARTESPVKKALIKVREAEIKLRTAHGDAAKNEARAARIEAKREAREAVANQAIENVEFDAAIGKLTTDQEIAAYTRLLHTLKLGRNARRSLIEKIHALQEEAAGNLELTVGNIALPSLYDIRRAIQGGITGGTPTGGSYNDQSTQNFHFNIKGDQKEVERGIHNALNRNTKNSKRSAGMGR